MNNKNNWVIILTVTLVFIGVILSSQSTTMEAYLAGLEAQSELDLLALWRNNNERLQEIQTDYYKRQNEYDDLLAQTSQGKVSIESFTEDIKKTRVFNGDVETTGPGLMLTFTGDKPLVLNELLDIINELNNSGAEALSINGKRLTSRTYLSELASKESEYLLQINQSMVSYPLVIEAIGDYNNLHNGLTIVGGIIDRLNSYEIRPLLERRESLVLKASNDKDNYQAVP